MSRQDFEWLIASNESDIEECFKLSIELIRITENLEVDPELARQVAKFYLANGEKGKVLFVRHKASNEIVGFIAMNFHYSLKRDEMVCRGTSLIIKKAYRGKGLTSMIGVNTDIMQKMMEYYRNEWSYVAADNHHALKIYRHWGHLLFDNIQLHEMDFVLRKDPKTNVKFSKQQNVHFFESKLASFGFKQGLGFEVVELAQEHFGEIAKQKHSYVNDINSHFDRFSMKGLQVVVDNPFQAACLTILYKGKVFGVISLMKYFHLIRNCFDVWITGIHFVPSSANKIHSDANIYILQALQRFLINYISSISCDGNQPICKG